MLGERQILRDLFAHGPMPTHRVVRVATEEHALPVGDLVGGMSRFVHDLRSAISCAEYRKDLRLDQLLPERSHLLLSGHGQQVGATRLHGVHDTRHEIGRLPRIGVHEADDGAARDLRSGIACPLLAEPAAGQWGRRDDSHPMIACCQLGDDRTGAVGGVVVHDHHLKRGI